MLLALRLRPQRTTVCLITRGLASNLLGRPKANEGMTVSQLRQEAKERGITSSGGKASLLARLQADDVTRAGKSQMNLSSSSSNAAARPRGSASTTAAPSSSPKPKTESSPPASAAPASTGVPPAGPSETTLVNHGNASHVDPVVNQTEESSRVAASSVHKPFQSSRTIKNPAPNSFPGATEDNRFQPRRSAPLNVQMPDSVDAVEEGPSIPVVPSNYDASAKYPPANTLTSSPAPPPKVITVSHIDTHLAAPSHPSQDVVVNPPVEVANYPIPGRPDLKNGTSSSPEEKSEGEKLTSDERKGLYVLGGIFVTGWLLGSFGNVSDGEDVTRAKDKANEQSH
ncbi:hypothetical protein FRB94_007795 [Tulasnella sp. JGI-2019a]|nr:hypothetical protein FRB94_007795 [Tulasnella sp. JGI-2019a]